MKIKILIAFFIILLVTNNKRVLAQESILRDISDEYVEKLIKVTKTNYPRYKVFKNRLDIARTNVSLASVSILDALTLSYVYQPSRLTVVDPENPSSRLFSGLQAGVFINLGTIVRMPVNIKRAKSELKIAQNEQAEYDLNLAVEVKKRYIAYIQSFAQLKIQTRVYQQSENGLKDMEYKYKKGEVTFDKLDFYDGTSKSNWYVRFQVEIGI